MTRTPDPPARSIAPPDAVSLRQRIRRGQLPRLLKALDEAAVPREPDELFVPLGEASRADDPVGMDAAAPPPRNG